MKRGRITSSLDDEEEALKRLRLSDIGELEDPYYGEDDPCLIAESAERGCDLIGSPSVNAVAEVLSPYTTSLTELNVVLRDLHRQREQRKCGKSGGNVQTNDIRGRTDDPFQAQSQNLLADLQRHVVANYSSTSAASSSRRSSSVHFRRQLQFQHDYIERLQREGLELQAEINGAHNHTPNDGIEATSASTSSSSSSTTGNHGRHGAGEMEIEDDDI